MILVCSMKLFLKTILRFMYFLANSLFYLSGVTSIGAFTPATHAFHCLNMSTLDSDLAGAVKLGAFFSAI